MFQSCNRRKYKFTGPTLDQLNQNFFLFLVKDLFMYEREREGETRGGGAQDKGEADSPMSSEPKIGLNPRTLRVMT